METDATQNVLIEALVLNVFSSDRHLNGYGPHDRKIHMEDLRDRLKDAIGQWVGENGERE